MSNEEKIPHLPAGRIFYESLAYVGDNPLAVLMFSVINYMFLVAGVSVWATGLFWPLVLGYYLFWSYFFRFYFQKKPYLQLKPLLNSLMPSSKILVIGVSVFAVITFLPFIPLLLVYLGVEIDIGKLAAVQRELLESPWVNLGFVLLFTLLVPQIFFRPFMAWISALLGRNRTLKFAWSRTRNNYLPLLIIALIMNLAGLLADEFGRFNEAADIFSLLLLSALMVYFNIVIAQIYTFFFEN